MSQGEVALAAVTEADLEACANEPIHSPGSIQPHGVLVAADTETMRITHASTNLASWFGVPAPEALGLPLENIIGPDICEAAKLALASENYLHGNILSREVALPDGSPGAILAHLNQGRIIIEIEPGAPGGAFDLAIERAQTVIAKLQDTSSLEGLCQRVASEVHSLTAYDRVMIYRFDPDGNGEVIAESRAAEVEPFLGLRYPASDIPPQAMRLYLLQRVRQIPDIDYAPAGILSAAGLAAPVLDLSCAALRSVSPVHLEYLRNMGVGGTLAISIIQEQKLWGMIVCHNRGPLAPSAGLRALCDLIGQWMGLLIAQVLEREALSAQIETQRLLAVISRGVEHAAWVAEGLVDSAPSLLKLVESAGVYIRLGRKNLTAGKVPPGSLPLEILNTLLTGQTESIVAVDDLGKRHPEFEALADCATGVLVLPIATSGEAIVWFRPEVQSMVSWGGDKLNKVQINRSTGAVSPRKSFAAWRELVKGQSRPWRPADIAAALELRRVVIRALLRHTEAELIRVSNADPLTGLANRRVLQQRMGRWLAGEPPGPAALLFCDLDRFKTVNDSLGHHAGDQLLHEVAGRLLALLDPNHLLVRLGGDEFVIFCENISETDALTLARNVLRIFETPFTVNGQPYRASTSVGIAFADNASGDLLREADAAMYEAKRQGANCAVVFQNGMHKKVMNTLRTEQDLFLAVERGELQVHYQPIVALPGGNVTGYEALARWLHPVRGWVPPADFIPLAEQTGLINEIGHFVTARAISALAALPDPGLDMAINVSAHQLKHSTFATELAALCARHDVAPSRIILEVTESTLMQDEAVAEIAAIRALGCRVAIDDFGTGYSSLSYMRRLPVNIIKIDRSFTAPLGRDETAAPFLRAIVDLVATLDLQVIAEGVETAEQRETLGALGCRYAQGYLFGKPQPMAGFAWREPQPGTQPKRRKAPRRRATAGGAD